jgi:hypothetical protein
VDNLRELKEFVWCDHSPVSIKGFTGEYTHVALMTSKAVHIVCEQGKVKILCHSCFVDAMKVRFSLQ